jgi:hypothetical protein
MKNLLAKYDLCKDAYILVNDSSNSNIIRNLEQCDFEESAVELRLTDYRLSEFSVNRIIATTECRLCLNSRNWYFLDK